MYNYTLDEQCQFAFGNEFSWCDTITSENSECQVILTFSRSNHMTSMTSVVYVVTIKCVSWSPTHFGVEKEENIYYCHHLSSNDCKGFLFALVYRQLIQFLQITLFLKILTFEKKYFLDFFEFCGTRILELGMPVPKICFYRAGTQARIVINRIHVLRYIILYTGEIYRRYDYTV